MIYQRLNTITTMGAPSLGLFFFSQQLRQEDWPGLNNSCIEQSNENLVQSTQDLRLEQWFTCQQDNDPEHTGAT